jgi:cobalamin biosynthesis protein CobT
MVEFSDCYFCGSVEEEVEQHPVIPPSTDPPTDRQRRVVLCTSCREKLERVTGSIVAHLDPGAADRAGVSAQVGEGASMSSVAEGTSMEFIGEVGTSGAGTPGDATDGTETPGEQLDAEETEQADAEETEQADAEETDETGETEMEETETGETETETEAADEPVELPSETRKILRLLENREFPVDREEINTVAANAYGVDADDVEVVFDTLIHQGRLREENGMLHKRD